MSRINAPTPTRAAEDRTGRWARLAWGVLASVHVVPVARLTAAVLIEGPTAARLMPWGVLVACLALFGLKAAGVRVMHGRFTRAVLPVLAMCFLMAHGDTAIQIAKSRPVAVVSVAIGAEAAVLAAPRVRRRAVQLFKDFRAGVGRGLLTPGLVGVVAPDARTAGVARLARILAPPRGPPTA